MVSGQKYTVYYNDNFKVNIPKGNWVKTFYCYVNIQYVNHVLAPISPSSECLVFCVSLLLHTLLCTCCVNTLVFVYNLIVLFYNWLLSDQYKTL